MEIKSVSFPRKLTLELDLSTGFHSQSTFRQRLDYRGGNFDNLGFDDGKRALPDGVPSDRPFNAVTPESARLDLARSFRNSWQYRHKPSMPKLGADPTLGNSHNLGGQKRFGYLLTAGYEYDSVRKVGTTSPNPLPNDDGTLLARNEYRVESGVDEVRLSALATASLDLGIDHSITLLSLYNRATSDETSLQTGTRDGSSLEKWQLQYLARTLWFNQALGITATCSAPGCVCAGLAFTPTASETSPTGARWPTATTGAPSNGWCARARASASTATCARTISAGT